MLMIGSQTDVKYFQLSTNAGGNGTFKIYTMDLEHQCICIAIFTNNIGQKYSHFIFGAGGGHIYLQLLLGYWIDAAEIPDRR